MVLIEMASLVNVINIPVEGIIEKVKEMENGKTVDVHNLKMWEVNQLKKTFSDNPLYKFQSLKDSYGSLFGATKGDEIYMARIDKK